MKQYSVEVIRKGYRMVNIAVKANSKKEAEQIALGEACSVDFSNEYECDYEIGHTFLNTGEYGKKLKNN